MFPEITIQVLRANEIAYHYLICSFSLLRKQFLHILARVIITELVCT
jgi:hypothetical protein